MENKIMPTLKNSLALVSVASVFLTLKVAQVSAQGPIPVDQINVSDQVGNISTLTQVFNFIFNLLKYLGWAGVIIGVGLAIFGLIYKLINEDNQKVMETVQSYITKAVVIVIAGIILISAGFIIQVVADLFGLGGSVGLNPDDVLEDTGSTDQGSGGRGTE